MGELRQHGAVGLVDAIRRFRRTTEFEYAASYEATAVCGLAAETQKAYASELERLARTAPVSRGHLSRSVAPKRVRVAVWFMTEAPPVSGSHSRKIWLDLPDCRPDGLEIDGGNRQLLGVAMRIP